MLYSSLFIVRELLLKSLFDSYFNKQWADSHWKIEDVLKFLEVPNDKIRPEFVSLLRPQTHSRQDTADAVMLETRQLWLGVHESAAGGLPVGAGACFV